MKNKFKRFLALFLAMLMVITTPVISMAEEITNNSGISLMSLFPIEEVNAYIDLTEFPLEQLPQMTAYELFSHLKDSNTNAPIQIDSSSTSVWANFFNDEGKYLHDTWETLAFNDPINILDHYLTDGYDVEVIIGSGNQLDPDNVRYFVDFQLPSQNTYMDLTGYVYDELYNFNVHEIVKNLANLKIKDIESAEILWYVQDYIDLGYEFESSITNGWLVLDYGDNVKFAPTLKERYSCPRWNDSLRMILKLDGSTSMYTVDVEYPEYTDMFEYSVYTQDKSGKRTEVETDRTYGYESKFQMTNGEYMYRYDMCTQIKSYYSYNDVYYVGMNLSKDFAHCDLKVIEGHEHSEDKIRSWINDGTIPQDVDLTKQIVTEDMSLPNAGLKDYWLQTYGLDVTLCVISGADIYIIPSTISVSHVYSYIDAEGIFADVNGRRISVYDHSSYDYSDEQIGDMWYYTDIVTYHLKEGYNCDDEYSIGMVFYDADSHTVNASKVNKAVVGHYYSLEEAKNKPDIKAQLFTNDIYAVGSGYKADFSGDGVDFTVFAGDEIHYYRVKTEESTYDEEPEYDETPDVDTADSYFRVLDLYNGNNCLDTYTIPYEYDTYYSYGYQTLLINDTNVNMTSISPKVNLGYNAKVYYGDTMENTNDTYSNKLLPRDFTRAPADVTRDPYNSVRYTVSAQNHINQKNYWVTAVKKESGAKLFVNGPDEREIFLNNHFGNVHDIFIANIGTEVLTGLTATINATNVKLDNYWTVGGNGNNTLAPFTTTRNNTGNSHGELFNVAKIRLIPDGEGEISGTLTITANGQEPRVITLTGTAGNPRVDTATLHDAVKYVPYSAIITTNNMHDWNKVTFSLDEGDLPDGLTLYPSGEIYGVPKETGDFPITVKASYSHDKFEPSYTNLVLTVKDNSDANINASVDDGYEITTRLPETISKISDMNFVIDGEFSEFMDLWLDGEKLARNIDYTAIEGSTKITVQSKTFSNAGSGKHTIAAEFRVGGNKNNQLKTASQNFTISDTATPDNSGNTGGGGGGGGVFSTYTVIFETNGGSDVNKQLVKKGGKLSSLPTPVKEGCIFAGWFKDQALTQPFDITENITSKLTLYAKWNTTASSFSFDDVSPDDWFYEDVRWAYTNNLMVGYNDTQFAPNEAITNSMVVTVLARLGDTDVTSYENKQTEGVADGQWYTPYAIWAKEVEIADDISFTSSAPITREMMGVVLVRFFEYMKKHFTVTDEYVEFADAALISDKAMNALQTLYKLGIFKGKGNNIIDPSGNTTRAEFSALIHRVHTLMNK